MSVSIYRGQYDDDTEEEYSFYVAWTGDGMDYEFIYAVSHEESDLYQIVIELDESSLSGTSSQFSWAQGLIVEGVDISLSEAK
jgi:hypothetical protein